MNGGSTRSHSATMTRGRSTVLEQVQRSLEDRPWEKGSWGKQDKSPRQEASREWQPPYPVLPGAGGLHAEHLARSTENNGASTLRRHSAARREVPKPAALIGSRDMPNTLADCHKRIVALEEQAREAAMIDATEIEKREGIIEGISDMFALSAIMPDKTRLYREYNEMRVKYHENLMELTRVHKELDAARAAASCSDDAPTTLSAGGIRVGMLGAQEHDSAAKEEAERKAREANLQRQMEAASAVKTIESATHRANVSEAKLREIESQLRSHPVVVAQGLDRVELASLLPHVLACAEEKMDMVRRKEGKYNEAQQALAQAAAELQEVRARSKKEAEAGAQAPRLLVEMDSLKATLARTQADLKALQLDHELKLKEQSDKVHNAEQAFKALEREAARNKERLSDVEHQYAQAQRHIERLTAAKTELVNEATRCQEKSATEQQRVRDLELHVEQTARQKVEVEIRRNALEKELLTNAQEAKRAIDQHNQQLKDKERELIQIRADSEGNQKVLRQAVERAEQRVQAVEARMQCREKEIDVEKEEMAVAKATAQREMNRLHRSLKERDAELTEVRHSLAHADSMQQRAAAEKNDMRQRISTIAMDLSAVKSGCREAVQDAEVLKRELAASGAMLDSETWTLKREMEDRDGARRRTIEELEKAMMRAKAHHEEQMVEMVSKGNERLEMERQERAAEVLGLREEMEMRDLARRSTMKELETEIHRERDEASAARAHLVATRDDLHEQLRHATVRCEEVQQDFRRVQQLLKTSEVSLQRTEDELARVKEERDAAMSSATKLEEGALEEIDKLQAANLDLMGDLDSAHAQIRAAHEAHDEVETRRAQAEQATAAAQADNVALRERLKEDSNARASADLAASKELQRIQLEHERQHNQWDKEHARALSDAAASHARELQEQLQQLKQAHETEVASLMARQRKELEGNLEVVAAEREARSKEREGLMKELGERQRQWESDKLRSDNELVQVQGEIVELKKVLAESEAQAQEAMTIVGKEMTAMRDTCSALEEQILCLQREKVADAKEALNLNMVIEQQAADHEQAEGALKSALKVADTELDSLKEERRRLQSELSTEKALREREKEDGLKTQDELARLRAEIEARDEAVDAMRQEALLLKAEVLQSSPAQTLKRPPLHLSSRASKSDLRGSDRPTSYWMARDGTPPEDVDADTGINSTLTQWRTLLQNNSVGGQEQLSKQELLILAEQHKTRTQQLLRTHLKKEVADLKSSDSAPPPAICLLWESLLVILGRQELRETDGVGGVLEWKFLRRFINVNPGQFDKESILFRMDGHHPSEVTGSALDGGEWPLKERRKRAAALLGRVTYADCQATSTTAAALYFWLALVLDMHEIAAQQ